MKELKNFYNEGFGWICRRCEAELKETGENETSSRLFREGEAESKTPHFSNSALAKWLDDARTTLICPRCKITESAVD